MQTLVRIFIRQTADMNSEIRTVGHGRIITLQCHIDLVVLPTPNIQEARTAGNKIATVAALSMTVDTGAITSLTVDIEARTHHSQGIPGHRVRGRGIMVAMIIPDGKLVG